jgi:hypothetical protein
MKRYGREKWMAACHRTHSVSMESCGVKQKQKGFAKGNQWFSANRETSESIFSERIVFECGRIRYSGKTLISRSRDR